MFKITMLVPFSYVPFSYVPMQSSQNDQQVALHPAKQIIRLITSARKTRIDESGNGDALSNCQATNPA